MPAFLLLNILILIQPALQVSESDSFLIYNENLKLCIQAQKSHSPILDYCDKDNEGQHFKWISNDRILNMAVKLCLAVPSKSDQARVMLSPCNETTELQKWECRNDNLLVLDQEDLFLNPEGGQKSRLMLSKVATSKSTWKIYRTKENLCSKHYEALYTLRGNAQGAPCVFPFKYQDKLYAQCIRDGDEHGQLWCGTTADVDRDSLTGYCPIKDDHDEFFWTRNHWTGDFYQINSDSALTWYQARKSCQQQNAELLSITDLQEQVYVTGLTSCMPTDLWIGLNSLDDESGWQWMGNYPLRYLNWAPGSPTPETEKICGSMLSKVGKWEKNKCQEKLGYICKKANSSLDASIIPSDGFQSISCLDGWVAYAGHCYHLSRNPKTWKSALSSCRKEGGDLISIHHIEEYSFVISQLGYQPTDLLWIGLNDQKTQMYYEWSDGTKVKFTKWQKGKPTQINDVQNECVIMNGEGGYWADYFCEVELGYICKRKPSGVLPEEPETADPNCQRGWKRHGTYCYLIGQTSLTFSEAKMFCETNKGSLTSVENRYEQAYLTSLVGLHSEKYLWIGLSDVQQPGTFIWTSGDSALFTHWNSEMPGQHSGCVAMRTGTAAGLWDVVNCEEKATFICKQWAEGVTTTPAPKPTPLQPCPVGWRPSSTRNVCFKAYTKNKSNKKSWFEAREFCRAVGGELISIHSEEEQKILEEMRSSDNYWIGLNNVDPDKGFTWSDGSNLNFEMRSPWFFYAPNAKCGGIGQNWNRWIPFHCDSFLSWVCQIKRGVPLKPEPSNDFDYSFKIIDNGWILYEEHEYYVSNTSTSAERARALCKKHGGDLTVIESETERKFLWKYNNYYGTHSGDLYIGLTVGLDGEFGWLDQTPVTYASWAPGEPNSGNDDETCVAMKAITGLWYDTNCGTANKFICERHNSSVRSTVAPTMPVPVGACADGWLFFNNKCFQLFGFNEEDRKNWSDARTACKKQGGNLASITSKAFQAFLTVHLKSASTDAWIGLNDIHSEHTFLWTDGSGVHYLNWAKGFPLFRSEDCVFMMKEPEKQAGNWKDGPCSAKKSYICQRNTDPALSHPETTISASGYTVFGNSSYSLIGPKMTWEVARKKCHSIQSELASIVNPYIQSFLLLHVLKYKEPVWIGLNSNMTGERYKWISNQRLVYTDWGPEEPKQKIACVYLHPDGHWKTGNCNETFFTVCERHHGKIPTEPPQAPGKCPESKQNQISWIPFRAHCYKFFTGWFDRPRAHFKCSQLGSTLASIEDLAELKFLVEHTQQNTRWNYWIGLIRNIEGEWLWEDKTEVDFVNWKANEPTFEPEDYSSYYSGICAYMKADNGEWYKEHCRRSNGFICKRHKIIEETTKSPTKTAEQEDSSASERGRVIKVVFPVFFILILIGAGTALYIVYRRRFRQQQTTGSFDNALYHDNRILIQNNESEVHVEDKGM
ncbi:macrophage mannose receptor 1-like [Podarcis raffonei]|uniref:macrophage mannose receptor 1-like n=1 Tax=Podarcis raffonei TaxID=65483 RepID=UPI0023299178|nr:macrophage mannose receptor 1-like [Podarcis raffonei]